MMAVKALRNYPREDVRLFGEGVNSSMYNASIENSLGGYGGCPVFNINNYPIEYRPYILEYLKGDCDSVAITYAAMKTKEQEGNQNG